LPLLSCSCVDQGTSGTDNANVVGCADVQINGYEEIAGNLASMAGDAANQADAKAQGKLNNNNKLQLEY